MALSRGSKLGPYEILAPLGAGGMGEVYRAHDPRLGREVAIKVLPPEVATDADRLRRFEQEARSASALNHQNILVVFDVGRQDGTSYLVTELLRGESLRERLTHGALPARRALDIATAIARGLAAAHEQGIVHRDLKPENVFLTKDGGVKILDFGLAKLLPPAETASAIGGAPTVDHTQPGQLLGTAGYMSPEQARGEPATARSDLFALGCILYEMLTGRRAFARQSAAETMAAILRDEPRPPREIAPDLPPALERLVAHCLEKEPEQRFQSARDLAYDLDELAAPGATAARRPARRALGWPLLAALAAAGLVTAFLLLRAGQRTSRPLTHSRLSQVTVFEGVEESPAWSPDGHRLAFSAEVGLVRKIMVRDLASGEDRRLTSGEADEIEPAFTPDGRRLLFVRGRAAGQRLQPSDVFGQYSDSDVWSVDLKTGEETRLIENASSPQVSPDGKTIAFAASWVGPSRIWTVDAQGRNPLQITTDTSEAIAHLRPHFSPDGGRIALVSLERTQFDMRVVELASKRVVEITNDSFLDLDPCWGPEGRELYFSSHRSGGVNIWRVPLHPDSTAAGDPQQLTTGAGQDVEVAVAPDGRRLAFGTLRQNASLWRLPVDARSGVASGPPEEVVATTREDSRGAWSPDGRRIAFNSDRGGEMNIWIHDLRDGSTRQLTRGPGGDYQANWSPDGSEIAFFSARAGNSDIWTAPADSGELRQVTRDPAMEINPFFSTDGRTIAFQSDRSGRLELWLVDRQGGAPRQLTRTGVAGHFMRWTPQDDGLYFRSVADGGVRVMLMPLAGAEPRGLPQIAGGGHISLSPDHSRIMDVLDHRVLWVSPLTGGEP
ncbi:MAG TPA: protein kinase, partial [Thermoanaerobaculia bacterium]|nr:protein kinase [Thermoanaerobaculia bacterium]